MSKILAIETSTPRGSVALAFDHEILYREITMPEQNSMWVLSAIDRLLEEGGIKKTQLDAISFGRGPGSFTGVRLATGIAQAATFALDIPIIPISTLQAVAQQAWRHHGCEAVLAALDARLNQVYWACYQYDKQANAMQRLDEERLGDPKEVRWPFELLEANGKGIGSGWDFYKEQLQGEWIAHCYPNAYDIAFIGQQQYQSGYREKALTVQPTYLRDQVAHLAS